jgi:predicted nucleotidyltransferase
VNFACAIGGEIDAAIIYGSVARQQDTAHSDVEVMIVSDTLGYGDVFGALEGAITSLGRKVNPRLYTSADWRKRLQKESVFVTRVWQQPKI